MSDIKKALNGMSNDTYITPRTLNKVLPHNFKIYLESGEIDTINAKTLNGNLVGALGGYPLDIGTANTRDTWVPVFSGDSKLQHRDIPVLFNTVLGVSHAGTPDEGTFTDTGHGQALQRSGLFTRVMDGTWWNLINVRHRNGDTDGISYGMQILKHLTNVNDGLLIRSQSGGRWSDWEHIMRAKVLFDNMGGTIGTVPLSESAANFTYMEIICMRDNWEYSSGLIAYPNGQLVNLTTTQYYAGDGYGYLYPKQVLISGNNITVNYNKVCSMSGFVGDDNTNKIIKVIGYR